MLPFSSYAIHYSHGPSKAVCKLFDFRKTDKFYWPWEDRPVPITHDNVHQRASILVREWHKKASLYKTNAILVPHGDDFRYATNDEWQAQRINLNRLFRFINNVGNYHVEVKFATLQEYFEFVETKKHEVSFPSLSGDFFTYSDEKQDYWSGYYTTRPYYKRMDRVLLHFLKASEILTVLRRQLDDFTELQSVRRAHSLFQHHDGVTGTARERVMEDYGRQMQQALDKCHKIIKGVSNTPIPGLFPHYPILPYIFRITQVMSSLMNSFLEQEHSNFPYSIRCHSSEQKPSNSIPGHLS